MEAKPDPQTFGDLIGIIVTSVLKEAQLHHGTFPGTSPLRNPEVLQAHVASVLNQYGFSSQLLKATLDSGLTKAIIQARQTAPTREIRVK